MGRNSEATLVDTWAAGAAGDDSHLDDRSLESSRETGGTHDRFQFATATPRVRRRIPLSAVPTVQLEADLPPPARRVAEGSSADLFGTFAGTALPVEVRLRRDAAPSSDQIDEVVAWLRTRRVRLSATPRPLPAPLPIPALEALALEPLVHTEPSRRGAVWPLFAVAVGLAAAMMAAIIL